MLRRAGTPSRRRHRSKTRLRKIRLNAPISRAGRTLAGGFSERRAHKPARLSPAADAFRFGGSAVYFAVSHYACRRAEGTLPVPCFLSARFSAAGEALGLVLITHAEVTCAIISLAKSKY